MRDGLAAADFDQKRALLELSADRVVVGNGAVEIRYAVPTASANRFVGCVQIGETAMGRWNHLIGPGLRARTLTGQ